MSLPVSNTSKSAVASCSSIDTSSLIFPNIFMLLPVAPSSTTLILLGTTLSSKLFSRIHPKETKFAAAPVSSRIFGIFMSFASPVTSNTSSSSRWALCKLNCTIRGVFTLLGRLSSSTMTDRPSSHFQLFFAAITNLY